MIQHAFQSPFIFVLEHVEARIIHKIDYGLSKLQRRKIQFDGALKTNNTFD